MERYHPADSNEKSNQGGQFLQGGTAGPGKVAEQSVPSVILILIDAKSVDDSSLREGLFIELRMLVVAAKTTVARPAAMTTSVRPNPPMC